MPRVSVPDKPFNGVLKRGIPFGMTRGLKYPGSQGCHFDFFRLMFLSGRDLAALIFNMKLKIVVHPRSKNPGVEKDSTGKFHVYVKQAPEKGKANRAVVDALAKYFKISKSQIIIISGFKSGKKLIEILK